MTSHYQMYGDNSPAKYSAIKEDDLESGFNLREVECFDAIEETPMTNLRQD